MISFLALFALLSIAALVVFTLERSRWEARYQGRHRGRSRLQPLLDYIAVRIGG